MPHAGIEPATLTPFGLDPYETYEMPQIRNVGTGAPPSLRLGASANLWRDAEQRKCPIFCKASKTTYVFILGNLGRFPPPKSRAITKIILIKIIKN